jgi:hypothetical protein
VLVVGGAPVGLLVLGSFCGLFLFDFLVSVAGVGRVCTVVWVVELAVGGGGGSLGLTGVVLAMFWLGCVGGRIFIQFWVVGAEGV